MNSEVPRPDGVLMWLEHHKGTDAEQQMRSYILRLESENERLKEFLRSLAAAEEPEDYGNTGNRDDDYVLGCDRAEWHIGQKALAVLDQDGGS